MALYAYRQALHQRRSVPRAVGPGGREVHVLALSGTFDPGRRLQKHGSLGARGVNHADHITIESRDGAVELNLFAAFNSAGAGGLYVVLRGRSRLRMLRGRWKG